MIGPELISELASSLSSKALVSLWDALREETRWRLRKPSDPNVTLLLKASPLEPFRTDEHTVDRAEVLEGLHSTLTFGENSLPADEVTKLSLNVVGATYESMSGIRQERLRQAKATFNAALSATVFGVIIVFSGIGLIYAGKVSSGVITTAVGALTQVVSALLFKFNKDANDRLDATGKDLHILDKARLAMHYVEQISDGKTKDETIARLVKEFQKVR